MSIKIIMKPILFVVFITAGTFFLLTLSFPLQADTGESETGELSGTVKVFRARNSGDVVVYLEGKGIKKEYTLPKKHSAINQKNLVFIPRVLPILIGETVDFLNTDEVQHNIFSPGKAEKFNLGTWGRGKVKEYTFNNPGEVVLLCNVHSEMISFIIVLENPFFAKTDTKGNFRVENIPPGTYALKTWHERLELAPQQVTIAPGETKEVHLELKSRKKRD